MKAILHKLGKLMSVRMLAIGLTFIQTIVITRVFGSEVFGLLSFSLSVSALAVLFLSAGLDQVLMRDVARIGQGFVAKSERWQHLWKLVRYIVIPCSTAVVIIGSGVSFFASGIGPYQATLLAIFLALPLILIRKYLEAICQGTKQVIRSISGSQIVYPILMILGAAYVWYFGIESNPINISLVYAIAVFGSFAASFLLIYPTIRKICSPDVQKDKNKSNIINERNESPGEKQLFISGIHFSLVSLGFVLGQHIDVLLMGILSTPEDVALVRIAARIAEMAALMRTIILLQYKPLLAESYGKKNTVELQRHTKFMVKIFVATGLPLTAGLWIFAEQAMQIFGPEFADGAWAMRIYVFGVFIMLVFGPSNAILAMSDHEGFASRILFIAISIQVIFNLILIPLFGVVGCAISNCFSMCTLAVLSRRKVVSSLGIEPSILSCLKRVVK